MSLENSDNITSSPFFNNGFTENIQEITPCLSPFLNPLIIFLFIGLFARFAFVQQGVLVFEEITGYFAIAASGMTHSAAMAAEILPGKTILEALNTDLVCDAINTAMRESFIILTFTT